MDRAVAKELFGRAGEVFHDLIESLAAVLPGAHYTFMAPEEYQEVLRRSPGEGMRIYWTEILSRAHWAAASNIMRHKRWHEACLALYEPRPNYLGFAAALRGLLEAAADAYYSLRGVPLTLAEHHVMIRAALSGTTTRFALSEELENALLHFQFARRLTKGNPAPESHKAFTADIYLRAADGPGRTNMKDLYAELCEVVHPAATSLLWMASPAGSPDDATLTSGNDKEWILSLCRRHASAIDALHMQSVNASILIFKVLNRFPLPPLNVPAVDRISMAEVRMWSKIESALAS
jgi:hypothetical protein